ncbi:MAG: DinB family protein [Bacteroidota bacterium]
MSAAKQLADRFREVMLNGKWVANTNYHDQIAEVDWALANQQVGSLNTVLKLTFHINYYIAGLLQVFDGGSLDIRDQFSFDSGHIQSPEAWEQLKKDLFANSERFAAYVETLSDEQLDAPFVKEQYGTYRRNIEVHIEHGYYHLGQVSIIKKLIAEGHAKAV